MQNNGIRLFHTRNQGCSQECRIDEAQSLLNFLFFGYSLQNECFLGGKLESARLFIICPSVCVQKTSYFVSQTLPTVLVILS